MANTILWHCTISVLERNRLRHLRNPQMAADPFERCFNVFFLATARFLQFDRYPRLLLATIVL